MTENFELLPRHHSRPQSRSFPDHVTTKRQALGTRMSRHQIARTVKIQLDEWKLRNIC